MVGKDDIALRNDSLSEERELPGICWPVAKLRRKRNNNRPLCDQEQNLYCILVPGKSNIFSQLLK